MSAVFLWGLNADGQCGFSSPTGTTAARVPHRAKLPAGCEPRRVSLGNHFSVVLSADGSVLTAGKAQSSKLGRPTYDSENSSTKNGASKTREGKGSNARFGRVQLPMRATCISAGSSHAAAVMEDGSVYAWGRLYDPIGGTVEWDTPRMLLPAGTCASGDIGDVPKYTVLAGDRRTVAVLSPGNAGLVVVGPKGFERLDFDGGHVVSADLGQTHAAVVLSDGSMWTWPVTGAAHKPDADAELGWEKAASRSKDTPRRVAVLPAEALPIVSCAVTRGAHHRHTACVSANGTVWAWGSGYKGKLGWRAGDDSDSARARPVADVDDAAAVLAGGIHAGLVDRDRSLRVWGCGSDGRLGFPESEGTRYLFRVDAPRRVEFDQAPSGTVIDASLGYYHSAAVVQLKGVGE